MMNRSLERDYHHLTPQGTLESAVANDDGYCFEAFDSRHCPGGDVALTALICFVKSPVNKNFRISVVVSFFYLYISLLIEKR